MSNDSWQTPQDLFDVLNKGGVYQGIEFEGYFFDLDLCATEQNSKCKNWCHDYLATSALAPACFMNPPYSNPNPFIEKAWEDSKHCKIVCLVKVDPSTKWWSVFWDYPQSVPKPGCKIVFFPKRIKFSLYCEVCGGGGCEYVWEGASETAEINSCPRCEGTGNRRGGSPSFASCLVIMDNSYKICLG